MKNISNFRPYLLRVAIHLAPLPRVQQLRINATRSSVNSHFSSMSELLVAHKRENIVTTLISLVAIENYDVCGYNGARREGLHNVFC